MHEGRGETCDNAFLAFRRLCRSSLQVGPFGPAATLHTEDWLDEPEGTEPKYNHKGVRFLRGPRRTATAVYRVSLPSPHHRGHLNDGEEECWDADDAIARAIGQGRRDEKDIG